MWGGAAGVVPPFAGGLTDYSNDDNDTKTDEEEQGMSNEAKDRRDCGTVGVRLRGVNGAEGSLTVHDPGHRGAR